jgi:DNA polymerase-4
MKNTMTYRWLYIDCNSFFASVEQELNPALRGKPIAVVPVQSDSTSAIAASYEAKAYGIKTGTPIYEAKKMCPDLICVLAQHEYYVDFHHRILAEIDRHIPIFKVCSIDEAACQLMSNESSFEQATALVLRIKEGLAMRVGKWIKCSIGIAPNRFLAKVAADMQKPDGLTFISQAELPRKLYSLALRDLPGIGAQMEQKLKQFGIWSMEQLCSLDLQKMHKVWGSVLGDRMWLQLSGAEVPDLETARKSLGHSHVLAPELRDVEKARHVAIRLTLKAASRLRRLGLFASSMSLELRTEQGLSCEASGKLDRVSDSPSFLHCLDCLWKEALKQAGTTRVKKISVAFSHFTEGFIQQPELFETQTEQKVREKGARISSAMDTINHRYGRDSILLGILPKQGESFSGTKIAFTRVPEPEEFLD